MFPEPTYPTRPAPRGRAPVQLALIALVLLTLVTALLLLQLRPTAAGTDLAPAPDRDTTVATGGGAAHGQAMLAV